jgi:hypothetical protein
VTAHEQEWAKLLLKCATLITAAARSLDHMEHTAKDEVAAEVYSAPQTRDYMTGMSRAYFLTRLFRPSDQGLHGRYGAW